MSLPVHSSLVGAPEDFNYTKQGENALIDGVDDAEEFQNTREAMRLLGEPRCEKTNILHMQKQRCRSASR